MLAAILSVIVTVIPLGLGESYIIFRSASDRQYGNVEISGRRNAGYQLFIASSSNYTEGCKNTQHRDRINI